MGHFDKEKELAAHIAKALKERMPLVTKNTEESTRLLADVINSVKKHETSMAETAHYTMTNLERAEDKEQKLLPLERMIEMAQKVNTYTDLKNIVLNYRNVHGLDLHNFSESKAAKPQIVTALEKIMEGHKKEIGGLLKQAETNSDNWLSEAKKHEALCHQLKQAAASIKLN